jgi:hypothetical protein
MVAATKELLRMVRPGGRLAITTWGPDLFEPANSAFWEAIREERPDLLKGFNRGSGFRRLRVYARCWAKRGLLMWNSLRNPEAILSARPTIGGWSPWAAAIAVHSPSLMPQHSHAC